MAVDPLSLASAGASLIPSVFKFFAGQRQIRQANKINPINPGFAANPALADNANILRNRYSNYSMPGYSGAVGNLNASAATAMNGATQGASSSGDVIDAATKINFNTGQNFNQLATTNARGADEALGSYLQANEMAGNEVVRKNMFDLQDYYRQLEEKAALLGAGQQNRFSAADTLADGIRYFTQPQQQVVQPGTRGSIKPLGSIYG